MCINRFNIYPANSCASRMVFVPCGHCEECRDSQRMQWQFRFRCELDWCRQNGYHIGFFTLTYNEANLPHIPRELFKDSSAFEVVPCFSRDDVRTFIDNIRKRCHENYKVVVKDRPLRYGIFSEYGDDTQRPHYHGIICFPKEISPEWMFSCIRRNWCVDDSRYGVKSKGFVFPRNILGGVDSHGYKHMPFLLNGDTDGAANYCAKYACKDIAFYRSISGFELNDKHKLFKRVRPFHIQSQGLGRCYLANKSSKELAEVLERGESFVGQLRTRKLPLYIRNKILFSPVYVFEKYLGRPFDNRAHDWTWNEEKKKFVYCKGRGDYCRLVRKEGTSFFWEHYREIYQQKKEYYSELFRQMSSKDFWANRIKSGSEKSAIKCSERFKSLVRDFDSFADYYLAYHGVPVNSFMHADPALQWSERYSKMPMAINEVEPWQFVHSENYDKYFTAVTEVVDLLKYCSTTDDAERAKIRKVLDFYHHLT